MTRTVLVPLDGSARSHAVLTELKRALDPDRERLILLTVAEPGAVVVGAGAAQNMDPLAVIGSFAPATISAVSKGGWQEKGEYAFAKVNKQLTDYLEKRAAPLRQDGFEVTTHVAFGSSADEIINYAREQNVGLIAMSTHGRTGLARLVFGSVAEKVLASGVAPVLLFRPPQLTQTTSDSEEEK